VFVASDIFEIRIFSVLVNNCSVCVLQIYLTCIKISKEFFK